jgi:peptidoglycan hydrolase-like protein with peptidoglycan-binding domain
MFILAQIPININITYYNYSSSFSQPTLRYKDKGEKVIKLQSLLRAKKYLIKIDGVFGVSTEIAVKAFQSSQRLKTDGVVGSETWKALKK